VEGAVTNGQPTRLRPSAKAVVVTDGRVLLNRNRSGGTDWYGFPGGGQRPGETLPDTLRREVAEETGCLVEPVRLLWVRELIVALRPELPFDPEDHAIEFMFECRMIDESGSPSALDEFQHGTVWLGTAELDEVEISPRAVRTPLIDFIGGRDPGPAYLGEVD
jgi:8-oxo-dGTP diphosphatase